MTAYLVTLRYHISGRETTLTYATKPLRALAIISVVKYADVVSMGERDT